jgi:hypothetical protein
VALESLEEDFQEEGRQIVNWIYKTLLPKIIAWLTGKDIDFDKVTDLVREAENTLTRGPEKAEWVKAQLSSLLNIAIPWILNFLVELAVAYCKKQGWIK